MPYVRNKLAYGTTYDAAYASRTVDVRRRYARSYDVAEIGNCGKSGAPNSRMQRRGD
jgi:hypothetical protein